MTTNKNSITEKQEYKIAQGFSEAWQHPTPEKLISLIHPDTILYQPHLPPVRGKENAYREFQLFLNWMPDFYGTVNHFEGANNVVYIDWVMHFKIGRSEIPVRAIDKIVLADNLIKERAVYFNTLPLIKAIAKTPAIWSRYWKYRTAKRTDRA